jgi:hypothetical protein
MTITEFLAARLDEDEWIAQGAARTDDGHGGSWLPVHFGAGGFDARVDDHIARHDPARVLREVEAGRRILALYESAAAEHAAAELRDNLREVAVAESLRAEKAALFWAVRIVAAPWNDHPDYDPDWAPA